jgi:hypothetical protein
LTVLPSGLEPNHGIFFGAVTGNLSITGRKVGSSPGLVRFQAERRAVPRLIEGAASCESVVADQGAFSSKSIAAGAMEKFSG